MSTLISIVGITVMPLVLIAVIIMIHKFRVGDIMKTEDFQKKYSILVEDHHSDGLIGVFWKPLQLVRWTLTLLIMVFLRDY